MEIEIDCTESSLDSGGGDMLQIKNETIFDESMKESAPANTITYRYLQVGGEIESDPILTNGGPGPYILIGNPAEIFNSASNQKVKLQKAKPNLIIKPNLSKVQKTTAVTKTCNQVNQEYKRRATHNEVERRRRDKINTWICKLGALVPETSSTHSKSVILAKACEYITEMNGRQEHEQERLLEKEKVEKELSKLRQEISKLKNENLQLITQVHNKMRNASASDTSSS